MSISVPQMSIIEGIKDRRLWQPVSISLLITPLLFFLFEKWVDSGGWKTIAAITAFPWVYFITFFLFNVSGGTILTWTVILGQYPVYGLIYGISRMRSTRPVWWLIGILFVHAAVSFAVLYTFR
jgi:hypothetical protein